MIPFPPHARFPRTLTALITLVLLDQGTKLYARHNWQFTQEVTDFFHLRFIENQGIAFSFPLSEKIVIPLTIIVLIGLGWLLFRKKQNQPIEQISYILLFAGATGNLIDRMAWGRVTDFLAFWNFPVFNLADIMITLGVTGLILLEVWPNKT